MRLDPADRETIKRILLRHFGQGARVSLFGSRTNDKARGGDIDLLVESIKVDDWFRAKLEALSDIQIAIGDQKIDLIVCIPGASPEPAIVTEARSTGVPL